MLESIAGLEALPNAHPKVTVLDGRPVHSMLIQPYRIYYAIEDISSTVYVIDVVHTAPETPAASLSVRKSLSLA